jgi:hypothetical protein
MSFFGSFNSVWRKNAPNAAQDDRLTDEMNIRLTKLIEDLEVFAGLEADGFARGDGDLGAGARVAADAGLAGLDSEDAEAAELDAVSFAEGGLHGFKDAVHGGLGLGAG